MITFQLGQLYDNISVGPALFRSHPQKGFAFLKLTKPSKAGKESIFRKILTE